MTNYTVSGAFQARNGLQPFTKTVEAPNEDVARDRVLSQFGAEHGLKRTQVEIDDVAAAAGSDDQEAVEA